MPCPLCGEQCTCSYAATQREEDILRLDESETEEEDFLVGGEPAESPAGADGENLSGFQRSFADGLWDVQGAGPEEPAEELQPVGVGDGWRQEIASRVHRYRSRRRSRHDAATSLRLNFEAEPHAGGSAQTAEAPRVIRFPRPELTRPSLLEFSRRHDLEEEELAEPVTDQPRIVEAEPPPADPISDVAETLAIHLDELIAPTENDPQASPLQAAAISQRAWAALVDAGVVLAAMALFSGIALYMTEGYPPLELALAAAVAQACFFGAIYQYALLVYVGETPGMRLAALKAVTFDGLELDRPLRKRRALATLVSLGSLGLGFAWAFVDAETLGWHDRISRTHLRSLAPPPAAEPLD